jgi:hypothetical protein
MLAETEGLASRWVSAHLHELVLHIIINHGNETSTNVSATRDGFRTGETISWLYLAPGLQQF